MSATNRSSAQPSDGSGRSRAEPPAGGRVVQMYRILVASDIRLYREGLAEVLSARGQLEVLATASDAAEAIKRSYELRPDVILVDLGMHDSFSVIRSVSEGAVDVKVVALSVPDVDSEVIACAEAGISGYVDRDGSWDDLQATIERTTRGEVLCPPHVASALLRRVSALAGERTLRSPTARLTARELEIVELIDVGLSNKEIARRLYIQVSTVKNHVHNILEKLEVHRRSEVVAYMHSQPEVLASDVV